jgi:hypothetical protein
MMRWQRSTISMLLLVIAIGAAACPICFGGLTLTTAQQIAAAQRAVLAQPSADGKEMRVVAVIKGDATVGELLSGDSYRVDPKTLDAASPLLMLHSDLSQAWMAVGSIGVEHADWLRRLVRATPGANASPSASEAQWRDYVAMLLPNLNSPDPIAADLAYTELSRAPYAVLRTLKPRLDATELARFVDDPARQQLHTLLLGIAGGSEAAAAVERRVDAASRSNDATNLAALLAADLELRGAGRLPWIEKAYFSDRNRTVAEIEAVLLALSVQGTANGAVPRERVIQTYRTFMRERKPMAGRVVQDFAAWSYWDAAPEYVTLLKTNAVQDPASRYAIVSYLMRSPRADTKAAISALAAPNP